MPEPKLFWYSYQVMITEGDGRGYSYLSRAVDSSVEAPVTLQDLIELEKKHERQLLEDFEFAAEVDVSIINFKWIHA